MEQPNLSYIDQLCGEDVAFKQKMIAIIKKELPLETAAYHKSIEGRDYKLAAECVHKLKHKISILGLERGYNIAHEYEDNLVNGTVETEDEFKNILQLMQCFVNGY
jgi:HPt (histidine-containing phosphotransfer) domain-containing protein